MSASMSADAEAHGRLSSLLPTPSRVRAEPGEFAFGPATTVVAGPGAADAADAVRRALAVLPYPLAPGGTAASGAVSVFVDAALGREAYHLSIRPGGVRVVAGGVPGAFYAAQTLRQLLPGAAWRAAPTPGVAWAVPCADIEDAPHLPWRGCLLDVARHFFPKHTVLRMIDLLAMHKLNRLHLHLVDDQGWRVESRRFPELTEVGAHRPCSRISTAGEEPAYDGTPHGGYYTLADLAEISAYAARNQVTVVPEIDVPGHASALLAARPDLGARPGADYAVAVDWGISADILSPLPATVRFLAELFDEILDAAPTPYVHLGGDECVLTDWEANPEIVAYQRSLGLADASDLQAHFLRQLADVLAARGCRSVVWDEAFVNGALRPDALVMAWRGMDVARRAAEAGHEVVATPVVPTYLDFAAADDEREPLAHAGPVRIEDVVAFRPVPPDWPAEVRGLLVGTQFQLWSERIPDERALDYMAFPRGCALAEVAWSASPEPWPAWRARLEGHLARLDAFGVGYRPLSGPRPWQEGGTGPRRHRPVRPAAAVAARLARRAERPGSAKPTMYRRGGPS